jgi:hypothetical protein
LYRLIAERIRQYQNTATKPDLEKFQKKKGWKMRNTKLKWSLN